MMVEFTRGGNTYQCAVGVVSPPPATLRMTFRACTLKPPVMLDLAYLATDEIRGIALYRPVEEPES